jgi:Uma2 family endonuclease
MWQEQFKNGIPSNSRNDRGIDRTGEPGGFTLRALVNGQRVEKPFRSVYGTRLAFLLATHLDLFARPHKLRRVVVEAIFALPLVKGLRERRPDAAFVSYERWAKNRPLPHTDPWPVVPNLAIEAISKSEPGEEVLEKIEEYFEAGVELVWVLYPKQRLVYVYESPTRPHVCTETDELDGGTVLPGFTLPVAALFDSETEAPLFRSLILSLS